LHNLKIHFKLYDLEYGYRLSNMKTYYKLYNVDTSSHNET